MDSLTFFNSQNNLSRFISSFNSHELNFEVGWQKLLSQHKEATALVLLTSPDFEKEVIRSLVCASSRTWTVSYSIGINFQFKICLGCESLFRTLGEYRGLVRQDILLDILAIYFGLLQANDIVSRLGSSLTSQIIHFVNGNKDVVRSALQTGLEASPELTKLYNEKLDIFHRQEITKHSQIALKNIKELLDCLPSAQVRTQVTEWKKDLTQEGVESNPGPPKRSTLSRPELQNENFSFEGAFLTAVQSTNLSQMIDEVNASQVKVQVSKEMLRRYYSMVEQDSEYTDLELSLLKLENQFKNLRYDTARSVSKLCATQSALLIREYIMSGNTYCADKAIRTGDIPNSQEKAPGKIRSIRHMHVLFYLKTGTDKNIKTHFKRYQKYFINGKSKEDIPEAQAFGFGIPDCIKGQFTKAALWFSQTRAGKKVATLVDKLKDMLKKVFTTFLDTLAPYVTKGVLLTTAIVSFAIIVVGIYHSKMTRTVQQVLVTVVTEDQVPQAQADEVETSASESLPFKGFFSLLDTIGKSFAALLGKLSSFDGEGFVKKFGGLASSCNSIMTCLGKIWEYVSAMLEWIYESVMGEPFFEKTKVKREITSVADRLFIIHNEVKAGTPLTEAKASEIKILERRLREYQIKGISRLKDTSLGQTVTTCLLTCMPTVDKALRYHQTNEIRRQPLWIHMVGDPGVGKTTAKGLFLPLLRYLTKGDTYTPSMTFDRKAVNDFWDGYDDNWATVVDDFLQSTDIKVRHDEALSMIYAVNTNSHHLHMSDVADKSNKYFCSEVVITTSNIGKLPNKLLPDNVQLTDMAALYRRMAVKCHLLVNKDFKPDPLHNVIQDANARWTFEIIDNAAKVIKRCNFMQFVEHVMQIYAHLGNEHRKLITAKDTVVDAYKNMNSNSSMKPIAQMDSGFTKKDDIEDIFAGVVPTLTTTNATITTTTTTTTFTTTTTTTPSLVKLKSTSGRLRDNPHNMSYLLDDEIENRFMDHKLGMTNMDEFYDSVSNGCASPQFEQIIGSYHRATQTSSHYHQNIFKAKEDNKNLNAPLIVLKTLNNSDSISPVSVANTYAEANNNADTKTDSFLPTTKLVWNNSVYNTLSHYSTRLSHLSFYAQQKAMKSFSTHNKLSTHIKLGDTFKEVCVKMKIGAIDLRKLIYDYVYEEIFLHNNLVVPKKVSHLLSTIVESWDVRAIYKKDYLGAYQLALFFNEDDARPIVASDSDAHSYLFWFQNRTKMGPYPHLKNTQMMCVMQHSQFVTFTYPNCHVDIKTQDILIDLMGIKDGTVKDIDTTTHNFCLMMMAMGGMIVFAYAATTALIKVVQFFFPNSEEALAQSWDEHTENRNRVVLRKRPTQRPVVPGRIKVVAQSAEDPQCMDMIQNVNGNVEFVTFVSKTGRKFDQFMTFTSAYTAIAAAHTFTIFEIEKIIFNYARQNMDAKVEISKSHFTVKKLEGVDIVRIDILNGVIPPHKSLERYIPTRAILEEYKFFTTPVRIDFTNTGALKLRQGSGCSKYGDSGNYQTLTTNCAGKDIRIDKAWMIRGMMGMAGDCGQPYMISETVVGKKLFLLHVAGMGSDLSYACPFALEDVQSSDKIQSQGKEIDELLESEIATLNVVFPEQRNIKVVAETTQVFAGLRSVANLVRDGKPCTMYMPSNTQLYPSPLQPDEMPLPETGKLPARLSPGYDEVGQFHVPLMNAAERLKGRDAPEPPPGSQDARCFDGVFHSKFDFSALRILSQEEAINGVPGDDFAGPPDFSASGSVGFSEAGDTMDDMFPKKENGKRETRGDVQKILDYYENLSENNDPPPCMAHGTLKDELRDKKKIWKPRLFCNVSKIHYIYAKRRLAMLFKEVAGHTGQGDVYIGLNVHSMSWANLHAKLRKKGMHRIIADDIEAWDFNMRFYFTHYFTEELKRRYLMWAGQWILYSNGIRNYKIDGILKYCNQVKMALQSTLSPYMIIGNKIYRYLGMPSGSYATAYFNSMYNSWMTRVLWYLINSDVSFDVACALATFGDDVLLAVSDNIPNFNGTILAELRKKYFNINTTSILKNGTEIQPFVSLTNINVGIDIFKIWDDTKAQFLKRQFYCNGDFIYPILHPESINCMLHWLRKNPDLTVKQSYKQNLETAMREIAYYGKGPYQFYEAYVQQILFKMDPSWTLPFTFEELMARYFQ